MTPSEDQIALMFDGISKRYDFLNSLLSLGSDRRWRSRLVQMAASVPGGFWLDVACGTGDVLIAAQKAHPEYQKFLGVDISSNMLKIAEHKCSNLQKPIHLKQASATNLELDAENVDTLTISFGLRNVGDKEKALREFHRVLKRRGTLLILEFFPGEMGMFSRLFLFYFRHVLPRIGAVFSNASAYQYLPDSVINFYRSEELKEILGKIGFSQFETKTFLFGNCRILKAIKDA